MNEDEELELIDAFEDEEKTKEFVPVGEKKTSPGRREAHRRTRINDQLELEVEKRIKRHQKLK